MTNEIDSNKIRILQMSGTEMVKKTAAKKGWLTVAAATGTVVSFISLHWIVGLIGVGITGYLAVQWFKFRGKWGLRF